MCPSYRNVLRSERTSSTRTHRTSMESKRRTFHNDGHKATHKATTCRVSSLPCAQHLYKGGRHTLLITSKPNKVLSVMILIQTRTFSLRNIELAFRRLLLILERWVVTVASYDLTITEWGSDT